MPEGRNMTRDGPGDSGLTQRERAQCWRLLEQERAEVLARIERHEAPSRQPSQPCPDELDEAALEAESAVVQRLLELERNLLAEIAHALAKLEDGSYGLCEGTGEAISAKRLLARPWARHSLAYKEELEARERGYAR
jgi:DnaK suppressor protein